ncbi:MAG: hypothetical protein IJA83_08095 [Clostridia bacterium]|nr:hypothetical protein [Clostridia bacterium]
MKKLISLFLVLLLMLGSIALADQGVSLFTPYYGTTVNVPGVYTTLSSTTLLYTGPGREYYTINPFEVANVRVRCMSLAKDRYGAAWVLVDVSRDGIPWCGYVPLSSFNASNQKYLTANLPYETSCDALTPMMIAQTYYTCDGLLGPGEDYPMLFPLESAWTEGTLILTCGSWGLLELSEYTMQSIGAPEYKCRLWVKLGNLFY